MKKLIISVASLAMFFSAALPASAGNNAAAGVIIGAGSGALLGQAVGRDAQAALVGGIIGSVVGLVIGSDYDRADRRVVYVPRRTVVRSPYVARYPAAVVIKQHRRPPRNIIRDYRHYRRGEHRWPDRYADRHFDHRGRGRH